MMIRIAIFCLVFTSCSTSTQLSFQTQPHNGHSHNDYEHERPLFDALDQGYRSIEVDVFPWNGELVVAHDSIDVPNSPSIEALYLIPLDSIVDVHKGRLFSKELGPLILMIDLKDGGQETLSILDQVSKKYAYLLSKLENGKFQHGAIQILISGEPSIEVLQKLNNPYLFIDGRFNKVYPTSVQPMVTRLSGHYSQLVKHLPQNEIEAYRRDLIQKAHDNGQEVRFWATPDGPITWGQLKNLGVDWISVDKLEKFSKWSLSQD